MYNQSAHCNISLFTKILILLLSRIKSNERQHSAIKLSIKVIDLIKKSKLSDENCSANIMNYVFKIEYTVFSVTTNK